MTTANQAFRQTANSPAARQAADTAKSMGEEVSDFASDASRKAGTELTGQGPRRRSLGPSARDDRTEPAYLVAVALGLGFLLGAMLVGRARSSMEPAIRPACLPARPGVSLHEAQGCHVRKPGRITVDAAMLCQETQQVMGLRLLKLARGGSAGRLEAQRMVAEKGFAFAEAAGSLATGASGASGVLHRSEGGPISAAQRN